MGALSVIDGWPVGYASALVVRGIRGGDGRPAVHDSYGDTHRRFPLASVTKLLTAYAVLVAVEEEVIGLDEPVAGVPGGTVRHLLAHASGLGPDGQHLAPPASRRIYSNAGFERLAVIVSKAAAMPFADYLTGAVLAPLAMSETTLDGSPASGATSTSNDLAGFAADLLQPAVLAPPTVAVATEVAFAGLAGVLPGYGRQEPNDWGLGFEIRDHKVPHWTGAGNSPATFGHFGQSGTFLWVDPAAATALICLTDRPFGAWSLPRWPAVSDAVLASS